MKIVIVFVEASIRGDLSLLCDVNEIVIAPVGIGAPVSHFAMRRRGLLDLSVAFDTCYAFNMISSVWAVLPAHMVWRHRKFGDKGTALHALWADALREGRIVGGAHVWT